jgi:hypothetical protein
VTIDRQSDAIAGRLRLGTGFTDSERDQIVECFTPLWTRLRSFEHAAVQLELSVKDRGGADPLVTLTCEIADRPGLVATSSERDVTAALFEVRDGLMHQVQDAKTRREPRMRPGSRHRPA